MKIVEKLKAKTQNHMMNEGVTIAFVGDSVTQGCFEIYKESDGHIETVFDKKHSYEMYVFDILATLYPLVTVNIINAGISGDNATRTLKRLDRDVIRHEPDLTVVCFGLNDCSEEEGSVKRYTDSLSQMFDNLIASGSEVIFMTPNMMNTHISPSLTDPDFIKIAERCARMQNDGTFDAHINAARALCKEKNIPVADCYAIWKKLYQNGVNTTDLLANKINHPTREMNKMFAEKIIEVMLSLEV